MKNIILIIPVLLALQGCENKTKDDPKVMSSNVAIQTTKNYFDINVDVKERVENNDSSIKKFTTTFQNNSCDIDVDAEKLKTVKMVCKKVKSKQDLALEAVFTPKGLEAANKIIHGTAKEQ